MTDDSNPKKKSRKEREKEWKNDGLKKVGGADLSIVSDRIVGDRRFERERNAKLAVQEKGMAAINEGKVAVSSTFDAFTRMAAGLEGRKIADKIADPNRPTWEQYKKDNEDKLNMVGDDMKKMAEYRAALDRERDSKLSQGGKAIKRGISDSEEDEDGNSSDSSSGSSSDGSGSKEKKKKHRKEKKKKHKKDKKKREKDKKKKSKKTSSSRGDRDDRGAEDSSGSA